LTAQALGIAITTRALLFLVAWIGLRILDRLPWYPAQVPDSFLPDVPWLDGWARWDTAHYVAIAFFGYGAEQSPSHNGGRGFLPLYPMLMKGVAWLAPGPDTEAQLAVAAILISNAAFLVALPLFANIVTVRTKPDIARTAT